MFERRHHDLWVPNDRRRSHIEPIYNHSNDDDSSSTVGDMVTGALVSELISDASSSIDTSTPDTSTPDTFQGFDGGTTGGGGSGGDF